jgi:SpoVK/Ycf46/Vps4 family AAA+-type ATPase
METTNFKSFHYLEDGAVNFSILDTVRTEKKLLSGTYNLGNSGHPSYEVILKQLTYDKITSIHSFPDKDKLIAFFNSFFNSDIRKKINDSKFLHKAGVLLYGKEGTGKSTIIKYFCDKSVKENDSLVFYINSYDCIGRNWEFIQNIRKIQDNPIIVIFEECENKIEDYESLLKSILDGNLSIDNSIVFATTNYIDKIPQAIKDRPSRFKYSINVESLQDEESTFGILNNLLSDICTKEEIIKYSKDLKGSTLDVLKQFSLDRIMNIDTFTIKRKTVGFN